MRNKFVIFVAFFLVSCAQLQQKQTPQKTYQISQDTEEVFNSIEQEDSPFSDEIRNSALRYRQLREKSWDNYLQQEEKSNDPPQKQSYRPRPKKQSKPKQKKQYSPAQLEEMNIQLEQMSNFYCMKHRNDRRFNNEDQCKEFTQKVLDNCIQRNTNHLSPSVVRCFKSKLKV